MSGRTQELKNLRAVATACKGYVDKSIDNLKWELGTYDLGVESNTDIARIKTLHANTIKSMVDYIGGKSVKYNQLVQNGNFVDISGWNSANGTVSASKNELTYTLTSVLNDTYSNRIVYTKATEMPDTNHKHLVLFDIYSSKNCSISPYLLSSNVYTPTFSITANQWTRCSAIVTMSAKVLWISLYNASDSGFAVGDTIKLRKVETIDLTNVFGAGNEPSDVATAITLLKANGYKLDGTDTYSTGSLKHAVVSGVKYSPINLWDGTYSIENRYLNNAGIETESSNYNITNFIEINSNYNFYLHNILGGNPSIAYYDSNYNFISAESYSGSSSVPFDKTCTPPVNAKYVKFSVHKATSDSVCFNISNASYNGNYYHYVAPITKAIPNEVLALDGYGWGVNSSVYNYIDYASKKFIKKVGRVDLGALNYESEDTINNIFKSLLALTDAKGGSDVAIVGLVSNSYSVAATNNLINESVGIGGSSKKVFIRDTAYESPSDLKSSLNGVYLYYELETPVETDISQYFTDGWNKVDLDKLYATCEMVCDEPIDMPNSISNLFEEVKE